MKHYYIIYAHTKKLTACTETSFTIINSKVVESDTDLTKNYIKAERLLKCKEHVTAVINVVELDLGNEESFLNPSI